MVKRSAFFPREHGNTIIHMPSFCMGLTHLKPRRGLLLWLDYILAAWLHEPHHVLDGGAVQPDVGPRLHSEQGSLSFANKTITILIMSQRRAPNLIGVLPCLVPSRQCTSHFIRFVIAESRARAAVAFIATFITSE